MKKIWHEHWKELLIFGAFLLYLLIQHSFVFLYHDDYGYLSLSYAVNLPVSGTNFHFWDIIHYLSLHYLGWGGRVLGFFYEIFFLHLGFSVYRVIQSFLIFGIFVLLYLLGTEQTKQRNWKLALFAVACYGTFSIMQLRQGIYWFTASCLYVWPMCFFFLFVYLYQKRDSIVFTKRFQQILYDIGCGILLFLATFSQEQIAALVLGYIGIITLTRKFQNKKFERRDVIMCLVSLVAFVILMSAPGNQIRMEHPTSADFYSLSLYGKIRQNIPSIINGIFGGYYKYFTGLFFLAVLYCVYDNIKLKKGSLWLNWLSFGLIIFMILGQLFFSNSYFDTLTALLGDHLLILSVLMVIHLGFIGYSIICYLVNYKEWNLIYLVIGAIFSQGVMLVAPYYTGRCAIPFNFVSFLLFIQIVSNIQKKYHISFLGFIIPFAILMSFNMGHILYGYYQNVEANVQNDEILKSSSALIQQGVEIPVIYLHKMADITYSGEQPYTEGNDYVRVWILEYYDLPMDTVLIYQ